MEIYARKETKENTFEVLGSDGSTLKNHNGKPYPILSENISRNLIRDLNHICEKYYKTDENDQSKDEILFNNVLARLSGEELRESFAYCLLSTLMEYEEHQMDLELEFEDQMQWDRLFRLNVSSDTGSLELNKTQKARILFCNRYAKLSTNPAKDLKKKLLKNI